MIVAWMRMLEAVKVVKSSWFLVYFESKLTGFIDGWGENIVNDKNLFYVALEDGFSPAVKIWGRKLNGIDFILPGSPTTNVLFVVERNECVKKESKI